MAEATAATPGSGAEEIEQGAYELLKGRLESQASQLKKLVDSLNARRSELFGGKELTVVGTERIRTENNCFAQDMVAVNGLLLFGYNAQMGMKTLTPADMLCLHRFEQEEGSFDFPPLAKDDARNFLEDPKFQSVFAEMVKYLKSLRLRSLRVQGPRLLAHLQTGETQADRKTLQWDLSGGETRYLDDKGEILYPPTHDFSWKETTRNDHVPGQHPHVNVANKVFVECVGGDLTIKIEDNTEDGEGIYREEVEHKNQALHDAKILYHDAEELILLRILPYREKDWRHLVYNTRHKSVHRIDAIGASCVMLPEGHGLIFPGGYYLLEGALKRFEGDFSGLVLARTPLAAPNGEDVLYVFRNPESGEIILLAYNLVSREMSTPIRCHGYSIFDDGTMVVFRTDENQEAAKVHPVQIWQTPFMSAENYELAPKTGSFMEKVGNAALVRGVSDCLSIARRIREQKASTLTYGDLIRSVTKAIDTHHWLNHEEIGGIASVLKEIKQTSELVLQEFDKVETLRRQAAKNADEIDSELATLMRGLRFEDWKELDPFVTALDNLRGLRGRIITFAEMKYAQTERLKAAEATVIEKFDTLSEAAVGFLLEQDAFAPYRERIAAVEAQVPAVQKANEVVPLADELASVSKGLEILQEIVATLQVEDPTLRTRILEQISEVTSLLNRARALVANRRKTLGEAESVAEFSVQFKLFGQNVQSSLSLADTPEKVDETLSSLLLGLEELEAKFGEFETFLTDLYAKREEITSSFAAKKQVLSDQRQRKIDQLLQAADRVIEGIVRRATTLKDSDKLNTFFASDPMVMKVRDLADKLREQNDPVKAEELLARLKVARQDSTRGLRDRQEMFEDGENLVKLGRHKFNLNTEPMEMSLVPRDGGMAYHITGTDYFEKVSDEKFAATKEFWSQEFVSETAEVYRAEYLAYCLLDDVRKGQWKSMTFKDLFALSLDGRPKILELVREYAGERYAEGYDRGVHDEDAANILTALLALYRSTGLLRYSAHARTAAVLVWTFGVTPKVKEVWIHQSQSLALMTSVFGLEAGVESDTFEKEVSVRIADFCHDKGLELSPTDAEAAAEYLITELGNPQVRFATSGDAARIKNGFTAHLEKNHHADTFRTHLEGLKGQVDRQLDLCKRWIRTFVESISKGKAASLARAMLVQEEAAVMLMTEGLVDREVATAVTHTTISGLLGQHPRISDGTLEIRLDEFLTRLEAYRTRHVPAFLEYQKARHDLLVEEKRRLRLDEFAPKVMSSFVRNKLINEVYLPLIGDNLAKQMGSAGKDKRTDQMGMLLLISPPGYGKTTIMEYIAARLGLIFVKVNGPALGHLVTSLDPAEANNATAAQEVEKVNFGLEMANNVMLYIDDIQHCNPEFLQKFISLCDGQRRIEGVWRGRTRTYDLKGKRFCIIMAGNPYTETGTRFQIPDMLANRADTYNLGDILGGKEEIFELSYLENALTSNAVLSPLAGRDPQDLYKFVQMAEGLPVPLSDLKHSYSGTEADDIVNVIKKLMTVQRTVLMVNKEYIRSAAQDDRYRTEPPFKLQGSYRNMNKMAEKIVPVMNPEELELVISDHYTGESQTLTSGSEQNLLKLAEMRGTLTPEQAARWAEIKKGFARNALTGGDESDPITKVTNVLATLSQQLGEIPRSIESASKTARPAENGAPPRLALDGESLEPLQQLLQKLADRPVESQQSSLEPQLAQALAGLQEAIKMLAQRPVEVARTADPVDMGKYMEGLSAALTKLAERPAQASQATDPVDMGKYLDGLSTALARLAERPVQVTGPVVAAAAPTMPGDGSAVPLAATGSPAQIPYLAPPMAAAPGTGEAPGGVVDEEARAALNQVIRSLRNIAEMVRGPQSRTILLDGYLVDTFDALRKAYDVDDLLNALKPVRKRESKRKA
jgi:hypothetical protein